MRKYLLILCAVVLSLGFAGSAGAFYMNFEEGLGKDGQGIIGVPGVTFTNSDNLPWRYFDSNTNLYNTHSVDLNISWNGNNYNHYGYAGAWLGTSGNWGRIDFDDKNGTWFQTGVTSASMFWLEAYDALNNLLDTATLAQGNLRTRDGALDMAWLRVDAGAGKKIAYVILHDSGNYWEVDNMTGDMVGGIPEPATLLLLGSGLLGLVGFRRKFRK